jgi:transposase
MYIRKSTRSYKGKTYTNYVLVESVQTPKGPRQTTICSLGDLGPRPREEWLKLTRKIEDALTGQGRLIEADDAEVADIVGRVRAQKARSTPEHTSPARSGGALIKVDPSQVSTEQHREAGPVHVGYQFWRRLELDRILSECQLSEKVRGLACVMTLNRLIAPCSEHAMPAWVKRTALADILEVDFDSLDEDRLYRVLDKLHPHRAAIETKLVARERSLFDLDTTVFLYDLTSTYFEGLCAHNPKAQRGHSSDHREDCKQVVIGLVVNRDGFPLAHEVFAGNRQHRTTLTEMLDGLGKRCGIPPGTTVVIDRGMAYEENIAALEARNLNYVVASRQSERDRWLADFEDTDGFAPVLREPSPRNPGQKKTAIHVKTRVDDKHTYVLCRSEQRVAKDLAIRSKHEARLRSDIDKLSKRIAAKKMVDPKKINQTIGRLKERYPRVARYYKLTYDAQSATLVSEFDADRHAKAEQLDGCYLLKTCRKDLSADEIWRIYVLLTRAEKAFRDMKSPLAERPIFHQREHRVEAHIFLCVLAYHLLVCIEKTLLDQNIHTSWATVRDALKTHQICTIVLPTDNGSELRVRKASTPEPEVQDLYKRLHISSRVVTPRHTWSEPK